MILESHEISIVDIAKEPSNNCEISQSRTGMSHLSVLLYITRDCYSLRYFGHIIDIAVVAI